MTNRAPASMCLTKSSRSLKTPVHSNTTRSSSCAKAAWPVPFRPARDKPRHQYTIARRCTLTSLVHLPWAVSNFNRVPRLSAANTSLTAVRRRTGLFSTSFSVALPIANPNVLPDPSRPYTSRRIATDPNKPGVVLTSYSLLDANPTPDERPLTRNCGRGPGQIMLNMRVGRRFRFGVVREAAAAANTGGGIAGGGKRQRNVNEPIRHRRAEDRAVERQRLAVSG
jgi:hypothetical protein